MVCALALKGAFRGFFREAFGLLALTVGIGASVLFGQTLGRELAPLWSLEPALARTVAHAVLFLGPYVGLHAVGYGLHRLGRTLFLGGFDRVAGLAFGALTGIVFTGAVLSLLAEWEPAGPWLHGSRLAGPFAEAFRRAAQWASSLWA